MGRKKKKESERRKPLSINLENWLWEIVDNAENNRSKFFRQLFMEDIKERLLIENLIVESSDVNEFTGELYKQVLLNNKIHNRKILKRMPIRRKGNGRKLDFHIKTPISISLDKWMWDLIPYIVPNRSVYFQNLLENKIKDELLRAGLIVEDTDLKKQHGELYCQLHANQKVKTKKIG